MNSGHEIERERERNNIMNLLFAIDCGCAALLLNCLNSISVNGGAEHYDAYVLHSDLDAGTRTALQSAIPGSVSLRFVQVDSGLFAGFPVFRRYPVQIYYRLAAPCLLPSSLDRVLYLDADTLVINSLAELYGADFEDNLFMACTHTRESLTMANRARLGIKNDVPYINTGVMMMNLGRLRKELDMEAIRVYVREHAPALFLPDQDILTALYGRRVKLLDSMVYNLSDRLLSTYNADPRNEKRGLGWIRKNSVVIHYYGRNKPWKPGYHGVLDVFYHELKQSFPQSELQGGHKNAQSL